MPLSEPFKEAADIYTGTLDAETIAAMEEKKYVFLSHSWVNNDPPRPTENWETLVEKLGGEDAINATFDSDKDPAFKVTHIESGKNTSGNGSVTTLANLWLIINQ